MSIELKRLQNCWQVALLSLALSSAGCLELQNSEPTPDPTQDRSCTTCHGDDQRIGDKVTLAAPPLDTEGDSDTKSIGVGAHQRHLSSDGHAPVACTACHVVPQTVFDPGHIDTPLPAEVTFGDIATTGNRHPVYDRNKRGCTDTYCHRDASVDWTAARSEKDACGTCHSLPPALPHPERKDCSSCHCEVIGPDGTWIAPERHINGIVDVINQEKCNACHGKDPNTGAPPPDLSGNTDSSARGVGAHANHLNDSVTHRAIACNECHQVPTKADDPGHIDADGRAEIVFGTLAKTNNSQPTYDANTVTCSNTYCHGSIAGKWQAPRDPVAACGSCHGLPPPPPHIQLTQCSDCHGRVVNTDGTIKDPSLHVDGIVEVDYGNTCNSCHGTDKTGAPPPDLHGNTDSSARGVGAHAQHLTAGATHAPIACSECHVVPATVAAPGHIDGTGVAKITFGTLASSSGYQPSYDVSSAACSGTYCHRDAQPQWQAPRSSDAACGSCHALPPPAPHPARSDCSICHAGIDDTRQFTSPELHVNGRVDLVTMPCNGCHGTAANGGPPPDTLGNTATSARGVGAHAWHLQASPTHGVVDCSECHIVPTDANSVGHRDTPLPAEVTFGSLAKTNGSNPLYSATDLTCSGSYCHGNATPLWTQPRSDADACGSCHGLPPAAPHLQRADCATCHGAVIDAHRNFIVPELHVNGQVDLSPMQCNTCHGTATNGAPPPDVAGNTSVSFPGVGAHQSHLQGSATHGPVACNECHVVPTAWNSTGHIDTPLPAELTFGALATSNGSKPVYSSATTSCTGSYCHGTFTPNWTAPRSSDQACGSCHALPPPLPHPQKEPCSLCHGAVIDAQQNFTRPELHVDGTVQVVQNCTACHGNAANAAPPVDLSGSSDPSRIGVGAHQVHLAGGNFSRPLACGECHVVPATIESPGHIDQGSSTPADVTFYGPAATQGRNPQWDHGAATCSGSWCHGPSEPSNQSPSWVGGAPGLNCTSCHGMPPAAPHPASSQCSDCHSDVDAQGNIVDRSLHVNGDVDLN